MEPTSIEYNELKEITDDFSQKRIIGEGGYGKVYWGLRNGREIAVKMLHKNIVVNDGQYQSEFDNLIKLKHENIVPLIGFCYESKSEITEYHGKRVIAEHQYRAFCFEYMHNGSLKKLLSTADCDSLNWRARYKIIKGICEGLKYLHKGSEDRTYHLDLKPDNILLDKNMVAKLSDFGLSKMFGNSQTTEAQKAIGTHPYMPPEYIEGKIVSSKNDIFSLGVVIIEIVMGPTGYSKYTETPPEQSKEFIDLAQEKWKHHLQATSSGSLFEEYSRQVKICTEIALECVHHERKKRPDIVAIIEQLNATEPATDKVMATTSTFGITTRRTQDITSLPVVKLGMWGGNARDQYELSVMPSRLLSVTIRCGEAIDSIKFSYIGTDLKEHVAGPWGGRYGEEPITIIFGPDEVVKEIYGTHGDYGNARDVLRSLNILTNVKRYSFGLAEGLSFSVPVDAKSSGHIVGFYARTDGYLLNAIGVYIHP